MQGAPEDRAVLEARATEMVDAKASDDAPLSSLASRHLSTSHRCLQTLNNAACMQESRKPVRERFIAAVTSDSTPAREPAPATVTPLPSRVLECTITACIDVRHATVASAGTLASRVLQCTVTKVHSCTACRCQDLPNVGFGTVQVTRP
jgi:hypothetical protein